jgi:hypothetical protein
MSVTEILSGHITVYLLMQINYYQLPTLRIVLVRLYIYYIIHQFPTLRIIIVRKYDMAGQALRNSPSQDVVEFVSGICGTMTFNNNIMNNYGLFAKV